MSTVTTWTWEITRMATMPNVPNQPDYVVMARWSLTGTDGTVTASIDGNTQFKEQAVDPDFVPYADLRLRICIRILKFHYRRKQLPRFTFL